MGTQGAWTKWEKVMRRVIKWADLWKMSPLKAKFLIRSVYDVLPTPSNLAVWGTDVDPTCVLCGRRCTLEHILSSCSASLTAGRYTYRHNQVLKVIARVILEETKTKKKHQKKQLLFTDFKKSGETTKKKASAPVRRGILHTANDWTVTADLGHQSSFPHHILQTTQRPDLIVHSDVTKQVIIVELTVPRESRVEEAHERKSQKYSDLVSDCSQNGWKCWYFPVEVGCRGFPASSIITMSRYLGISISGKKSLLRDISTEAEQASCWIWTKHRLVTAATPPLIAAIRQDLINSVCVHARGGTG